MKTFMHWTIVITQFFLLSTLCNAAGKVHNAGAPDIAGRGLYQEASTATYSNEVLTLEAPDSGWLHDMQQDVLNNLKEFDLKDLSELSLALVKGIRNNKYHVDISLEYPTSDGKVMVKKLSVRHFYANGNQMQYFLRNPVDLPAQMSNVTLLIKTWPMPAASSAVCDMKGSTGECCHCSASCQFEWALFGYCPTCVAPLIGTCDKFCP